MNDLLKRLNMKHISDLFDTTYEKYAKDTEIPEWLSEDFVLNAARDCYIRKEVIDLVMPALPLVRENKDLVLFSKILHDMLKIRKHHSEVFGGLEFPEAPSGENPLPYDLFSFFPMLSRVREAFFELRKKGVDEEILKNTYSSVGGSIISSKERMGKTCFPTLYFLWTTTNKNAELFTIGRFNFELRRNCSLKMTAFINKDGETKILMSEGIKIHKSGLVLGSLGAKEEDGSFVTEYKETEDYYEGNEALNSTVRISKEKTRLSKNEWSVLCAPGDDYVSVHIPSNGSFDAETVEKSLNEGREFFKMLYPESDFKAFMCISWLLASELKEILKPTSNIVKFQDRFYKFPVLCGGLDIFNFVFGKPVKSLEEVDFDSLSEDSSLKKSLKERYKKGNYLHEAGGVFKF